MKIKFNPTIFRDTLSFLSSTLDVDVSNRNSYVLVSADKDKGVVEVKAVDDELYLRRVIEVEVLEGGTSCVHGRKLSEILKHLTEEVTLNKEKNDWLTVKSGKSKFKVPGLSEQSFPTVTEIEAQEYSIEASVLRSMLTSTEYAISHEESRYVLNSVELKITDNNATMVGCDGYRVSYASGEATGKETLETLILASAIDVLKKLPNGLVEIGVSDKFNLFKMDDLVVMSRKIAHNFPKYAPMFNEEGNTTFKINSKVLLNSVNKVSLMSDNRIPSMKFSVSSDEMTLRCESANYGESEDTVEVREYDNKERKFVLNWRYLRDFLSNCPDEDLTVSFKDSTKPILFIRSEGHHKSLIMPMRE